MANPPRPITNRCPLRPASCSVSSSPAGPSPCAAAPVPLCPGPCQPLRLEPRGAANPRPPHHSTPAFTPSPPLYTPNTFLCVDGAVLRDVWRRAAPVGTAVLAFRGHPVCAVSVSFGDGQRQKAPVGLCCIVGCRVACSRVDH